MKSAAVAAALFGAVVMLAFVLWKTLPWSFQPAEVFPVLALVGWVVSPFLPLTVAAAISRTKAGTGVSLALGVVATLLGAVVYGDAFLRHDNPLNLFLFLGIPVWQWGIGIVALVAAAILRRRRPDAA